MPSIVNRKAGTRRASEPADRHSIQIKLNDQEFEQLELDLAEASKGPGGVVRPGAYAKNAIAQHAKLFAFRVTVASLVYGNGNPPLALIGRLREALATLQAMLEA